MTPRSTSSNLIPTRQRTRPLVTTRAAVSPGEVIHRGAPAATVVLPRIPWGSRPSRRRCRALTVRREEPSRTFPMSDPCVPQEALPRSRPGDDGPRSEEHTSELQSRENLVCRLLLEKKEIPTTRGARRRCCARGYGP